MNLANKTILVTGADGFIGSHLTEALVRQEHDVRAFVRYNLFNSWGWLDSCTPDVAGQFEVFAGDIRDPHGVKKAMEECDVVMHLAALIDIPYSYHSPNTYVDTNIKGTLNMDEHIGHRCTFRRRGTRLRRCSGNDRVGGDGSLQGLLPHHLSGIDFRL
jgi:nucleoside-diphosphate-sugar epimerase